MKPSLTQVLRQALSQGARLLDDETRDATTAALQRDWLPCGAVAGHAGEPDLYYTLFSVFCADAMGVAFDAEKLRHYLAHEHAENVRGASAHIHRVCRVCLESRVGETRAATRVRAIVHGTAAVMAGMVEPYAAFWGCLALEATGLRPPWWLLTRLSRVAPDAATPRMAAQLVLMGRGGRAGNADVLRLAEAVRGRRVAGGGFRAGALAPQPDLLSTATSVFALALVGQPESTAEARETFDFTAQCWTPSGHWADRPDATSGDCEFTFYALLALGSSGIIRK